MRNYIAKAAADCFQLFLTFFKALVMIVVIISATYFELHLETGQFKEHLFTSVAYNTLVSVLSK